MDIYQHGDWKGVMDRYTSDARGVKNNDGASSLKLPSGCCVRLFIDGGFGGGSVSYCKSIQMLTDDWNDKMSSLKIFPGK